MTWSTRDSFAKLLMGIKALFDRRQRHRDSIRKLIYFWRSYCVLVCLRVLLLSASRSNNKHQLLGS